MTRRAASLAHEPDRYPLRLSLWKVLDGLAASPWALSGTGFLVTALLIRSNALSVF